jgi:RNA-directed DNA polymerase
MTAKSISIKGTGCKSGGCALKAVELASGDLPFVLESGLRAKRFVLTGRQKSAEGVAGAKALKARTVRRKPVHGSGESAARLMGDKRQKNQLKLAFGEEDRGEAPKGLSEGTETLAAKRGTESPAIGEQLMEEVCERENCKQALKRVKANKGSAGVDGMTVHELPEHLKKHWPAIREQLLSGTYKPQPVKRVEIPKPDGGVRKLGIPTVLDRFIQQAVMQVLQRKWDPTFSEHSYGFRPGRSAHQAVEAAQKHIAAGYRWCVDLDLEKFFDRVSHDKLMAKIAEGVSDKRMLKLIRAFLRAGVMEGGLVSPVDEGTPQGGPLSPLLRNIVLDEFDRELERRGLRFVRYADDCNGYVRSGRAGERVMESLKRFITTKLKLKVNGQKSAVARPWERKFLGFSFTAGQQPKRRIAPKAVDRFKERVRELTSRTRGVSTERMAEELARYLRGWLGYFGRCETPSVLAELDRWLRRRLRSAIWKQWKRGSVRFAELRKRGVGKDLAAQTAGSAHGPWRLANSPALAIALPNAYFDSLGIPRLTGCR